METNHVQSLADESRSLVDLGLGGTASLPGERAEAPSPEENGYRGRGPERRDGTIVPSADSSADLTFDLQCGRH